MYGNTSSVVIICDLVSPLCNLFIYFLVLVEKCIIGNLFVIICNSEDGAIRKGVPTKMEESTLGGVHWRFKGPKELVSELVIELLVLFLLGWPY